MNIEFTGKYDAVATKRFAGKVYDRIARGMWVFGCVFFAVCAVVEALQLVSGRGFNYCLLAIAVVLFWSIRFGRARYQKNIDILCRRYFSDSEEATVMMTDDSYECRCGTNLMRVAWRNLGAYYLFVGDGVVLLMDGKVTTLLLPSLSKMSVQADELKDALARAGLKDYSKCRSCGWLVLFLAFVVGGFVVFSDLARIRPQNPQNASCIDKEDEDDAEDLLKEIEKSVKARQRGEVIRLEIEHGADKKLISFLTGELNINENELFYIDGPLDLTAFFRISSLPGFDSLRNPSFEPAEVPELPAGCDIFAQIRKGDILLFHPYQSFEPVVDFIRNAASDPDVLAIKQTLYRVSGNSPIIAALAQAAENGKQVTVLVELKARFDEEHNIVWARMLEKAGCHVIYGLVGLKTHSKITLVVRKENEGIRRYVHLGTGNYNDATARIYTDIGLLTCREQIGEDATAVFNMLSGYSEPKAWNSLVVAPLWLKDRFLYLIEREAEIARSGKEGRIVAKMNSLSDPDIIEALYKASAAGVRIELIVRGICCLKTGIKGVSENISVRSITGNFLEHARIFWFKNDENPEVYCGSADWMPRNLDRRVEIVFPVTDESLKARLWHILNTELKDNRRANVLRPLGCEYVKEGLRQKKAVDSQLIAVKEAADAAKKARPRKISESRVFIPKTKPVK